MVRLSSIEIRLNVNAVNQALEFYCNELGLFSLHRDYGMGNISIVYKNNPSFKLMIFEGQTINVEYPLFSIETENCTKLFHQLLGTNFSSNGKLISKSVFEYPIGKNILLQDPSGNKFLIFENF